MSENVLSHGADGTGVTDSTPAFVEAITTLGKRGGTIEIPIGRYRIDQAPLVVSAPLHFRGEGGMVRTAVTADGHHLPGSVTTLLFPPDRDGFVVEAASSGSAHFEDLALVRTRASGPDAERFARRGIHAQSRIRAESLYLLNWERGIDLDGRTNHPADPDHVTAFATNDSYVSRIFAEDCFWATYAHGQDAQASHFEHVLTLSCEAGVYDSSEAGNGYVDCYVDGGFTEPPYYMDNLSVLLNCQCEAHLPPQFGRNVTVVGGGFNVHRLPPQVAKALGVMGTPFRQINGVPAKHEGGPFPGGTATFAAGETIGVTVDGVARTIALPAGAFTPRQVADRINAAFADLALPRVATANGFDQALTVEGWRGHDGEKVSVTGAPATLAKIGFPAARPSEGMTYGQMLSAPECSRAIFRAHSGLDTDGTLGINIPGVDEQLDVEVAYDAVRPVFWQIRGAYGDDHEFGVLREAGKGVRRWAFTRASSPRMISLAFTMPEDSLGPDQAVAYDGLWLQNGSGGRRVLLRSGAPEPTQGALEDTRPPTPPHDFAWDLSTDPPQHHTRTVTGWVADHAAGTAQPAPPAPPLELTLDQRSLVDVDDAAGRWQFEGGQVLRDGKRVADYAGTRRVVTGGTDVQNVAMLTLTLFFLDQAGEAGDSMTLQGAYRNSSGVAVGSVSAASSGFADRIGAQFRQVGQTLLVH